MYNSSADGGPIGLLKNSTVTGHSYGMWEAAIAQGRHLAPRLVRGAAVLRWPVKPAFVLVTVLLALFSSSAVAQVAVFWQPGFPTIDSRPLDRAALVSALHPAFVDLEALETPGALDKR